MRTLNTLEVNGRLYSENDIVKMVFPEEYGFSDRDYGGRIKRIGITDTDVVLLLDYNFKPFDSAIEERVEKVKDIKIPETFEKYNPFKKKPGRPKKKS